MLQRCGGLFACEAQTRGQLGQIFHRIAGAYIKRFYVRVGIIAMPGQEAKGIDIWNCEFIECRDRSAAISLVLCAAWRRAQKIQRTENSGITLKTAAADPYDAAAFGHSCGQGSRAAGQDALQGFLRGAKVHRG